MKIPHQKETKASSRAIETTQAATSDAQLEQLQTNSPRTASSGAHQKSQFYPCTERGQSTLKSHSRKIRAHRKTPSKEPTDYLLATIKIQI